MAVVKSGPLWFRVLEIIFGIIGIIITLFFARVWPLWIILNHYLFYIGGWMLLFGVPVMLFGILWLVRAFVFKDEKKWLRGSVVLLGIIMISMAMIGMYLDFFGLSLLGWEIMGLIDNMVGFIAVIFLIEAIILMVHMIMGEFAGWFKWFGLILAVIELVFAVTALVFIPMTLLLTIALLVLSGVILILRGILSN